MSNRTEASRPNILVLMSDQHSKRQLGCYGDSLVRTPNLDRLASEGMLFENAYCPSPVCVPSRMSFMTGRTPTGNRVWTNQNVLHSGIPHVGALSWDSRLRDGPDRPDALRGAGPAARIREASPRRVHGHSSRSADAGGADVSRHSEGHHLAAPGERRDGGRGTHELQRLRRHGDRHARRVPRREGLQRGAPLCRRRGVHDAALSLLRAGGAVRVLPRQGGRAHADRRKSSKRSRRPSRT